MGRFRRLRKTEAIRNLVRETTLSANDVIQPFFLVEGKKKKETIVSMPGIYRFSLDFLLKEIEGYIKLGGQAGLFFGIPHQKDAKGSLAYQDDGFMPQAIRVIKKKFPQFIVITDVCLCGYTDHGHCGVVINHEVENDQTVDLLARMALAHAQAGADFVAPSDMMDFRVAKIRRELDQHQAEDVGIISYAVKYASAYYGPFRDAAHSKPTFGNRKTYQMDPANSREAIKEARQDVLEGADMVMVKPALAYLDIVANLRRELTVPIVAYSVSGEYAMMKAAAQKKWISEKEVVLESHLSMKRAGADIIISYYAKDVLNWIFDA